MKQSSHIMKLVMSVLLIGVIIYFGVYLVRSFRGGVSTVIAYADSVNVGVEVTGVLVREEQLLTNAAAATQLVDLTPAEGEKVAGGETIATLYASAADLEVRQQIKTLETEIEQLQYVLNSSGDGSDTAKLDAQILSAIAGFHSAAALGDLSDLEDDALELRSLIFKRDYAFDGSDAVTAVSAVIREKTTQLSRLRSTLGSVTTSLRAPCPGVFSGVVDGYETVLTPAVLTRITPSQLQSLAAQPVSVDPSALGKLITSSTWYFTAVLPEDELSGLYQNGTYTVAFSHDWSGEAEMTLERISDSENGQVALVFSCRSHLADTTLLRKQTVDVVTSALTGLRIPRQALRTVTQTVTDKETGESEEVTVTGVYAAVGAKAEFKPVTVLWQDNSSFLVKPADPLNSTANSDRLEAERLQDGDEVIVSTSGLYDGKVIR